MTFERACPTADGCVDASERTDLTMTREERLLDGHVRESVTMQTRGSWRGQVEPGARLGRLTFDVSLKVGVARSGSVLRGLVASGGHVTVTIGAAGSVDPRSRTSCAAVQRLFRHRGRDLQRLLSTGGAWRRPGGGSRTNLPPRGTVTVHVAPL